MSVAVYSDSNGQPGTKLVDLVSPTEFAAGHSFFEAPPGTNLEASTSYVMVWSYLSIFPWHRLQKTSSNNEDSGGLTGASVANAFYRGADVGSLSEDLSGNALEIAVYTEVNTETVVYILEPPPPPPPPPFVPGVTGGGPGHFGGGAILRCLRPAGRKLPHVRRRRPRTNHLLGNNNERRRVPHKSSRDCPFNSADTDPPGTGSLGTTEFTYRGTNYSIEGLLTSKSSLADVVGIVIQPIFPSTFDPKLTLELDGRRFLLKEASRVSDELTWNNPSITWAENESVAVKLIEHPQPNAYGYRTMLDGVDDGGSSRRQSFRIRPSSYEVFRHIKQQPDSGRAHRSGSDRRPVPVPLEWVSV